jgi:gamma-glutamyltranspeptidase / glutathione hydrolase
VDVTRYARSGMVCTVDHLASGAGVAMLRAGGSAADAAVAASAVLAVTTQHMCGMGGDLFAIVHHERGAPAVLNASGRAGSGADPQRMRAEGFTRMPTTGDIRSVPVPGCVDGWLALHERFGRLPITDVLDPAWQYASDGFPASPILAWATSAVLELPGADDYRAPGPIRPGTVIRRPGVARALAAVAEGGRDGFYRGDFGAGLVGLGGGEYLPDDLATTNAEWVEPLDIRAWGHQLWTAPPNSQGYLTLAAAGILQGLELPTDPADPRWAHLLVEASRLAGHDRLRVLFEGADGRALIAPERLARRRASIHPDRAAALADPPQQSGGTIYLCAVDGDRMGVSLIQSNASGWGAHIVEPTTRIFLQDRGIGFSLEPGHPAEYGPRRRPPHTLSPALVTTAAGELRMVLGTMGGDGQPQIVLQLLARMLHAGETPGAALAAPRWVLGNVGGGDFGTWRAGGAVEVQLEAGAPPAWRTGLEQRGHPTGSPFHVGHAHVISVGQDHLAGAADPRAQAEAAAGL